MSVLMDILKSDTFWTAFGSVATAIGVTWVIIKEVRGKARNPSGTGGTGPIGGPSPGGRTTNRTKIQLCLAGHPDGATLEQIASETGIPIGSLSSDMAGREAMGVEKQGYGKTAIFKLR